MNRPYNHTLDNTNSKINKAKELAAKAWNESNIITGEKAHIFKIEPEQFFIVWYSKTLQNWKAMLSTAIPGSPYFEVTYNGDKQEAYVDMYAKVTNVKYGDILGELK